MMDAVCSDGRAPHVGCTNSTTEEERSSTGKMRH